MSSLLSLVAVLSLVLLVVGLIRPSLVLKWGKRTRIQAFVTYAVVFFLATMGLGMTSPESGHRTTRIEQAETQQWYSGGTLHQKTGTDWIHASHRDKLATCADFVATVTKQVDKDLSEQLVVCIDKATEAPSAGSIKVSELAGTCMLLMGIK